MRNTKKVVSRRKAILKAFSYTFCKLVGVVFAQCYFLTELRSATLHETISNYGTHTAKHNLTPELHACCSNNTQCISNLLRQTRDHFPTTFQKLIFVSENILHAQKFRKKVQVRNTT